MQLPWDFGYLTVFRGVNGETKGRALVGLSWSISLPAACWFATRSKGRSPRVYVAQLKFTEVACWVHTPTENEVIAWPKKFYPLKMSADEMKDLAKEYLKLAGLDTSG